MTPDRNVIEAALLRLIGERAPGKTLDPTEAARALGGDHPDGWGPLMLPIRRVAVALAEQGRIEVACEFCNRKYSFDRGRALALFAPSEPSPTLH